ncbi:MAG: hypothetical protein ABIJ93_01485, partial [candidate division WOR-3 bacterium]
MNEAKLPDDFEPSLQQREIRLQKLNQLRAGGILPYAYHYRRTHLSQEVIGSFEELNGKEVRVAGRVMSWRRHGKTRFAHILDGAGRLQLYFRQDVLGAENYE